MSGVTGRRFARGWGWGVGGLVLPYAKAVATKCTEIALKNGKHQRNHKDGRCGFLRETGATMCLGNNAPRTKSVQHTLTKCGSVAACSR